MITEMYINDAIRTESDPKSAIDNFGKDTKLVRLAHGIIGLSTEAGELLEIVKKTLFYSKEVDHAHLVEELGDAFWYLALICDSLELDPELVMRANIAKLAKRYPDKFSDHSATSRDLDAERAAIEAELATKKPKRLDSTVRQLEQLEALLKAAHDYTHRHRYPEDRQEAIVDEFSRKRKAFQEMLLQQHNTIVKLQSQLHQSLHGTKE